MTSITDQEANDNDLLAADAMAGPGVSRHSSKWLMPLIAVVAILLGGATFSALAAKRAHPDQNAAPKTLSQKSQPMPPVPVLISTPAIPAAQPPADNAPPPPALDTDVPPAPTASRPVGGGSTALVVDLSVADQSGVGSPTPPSSGADKGSDGTGGQKIPTNQQFADRFSKTSSETSSAERLASNDYIVPQGTIIVAVLESAIDSDLPGPVRAVVSRDVPGFDGSRILIPRGSRLMGQYSSGVAVGQSRAFVIWTRVLRSDGVSVQLGSIGTDPLGMAGLGGKVNTHFLRRFGAATLLSVVSAGLDYLTYGAASANSVRNTQVVVDSSQQANQLAGVALQRSIDIPPTIKVMQGTPVRVFVARDLDFATARESRP